MALTYNGSFQEHVIDTLARIETRQAELAAIAGRVDRLEAARNYLAGAVGLLTTIAGYIHLKT